MPHVPTHGIPLEIVLHIIESACFDDDTIDAAFLGVCSLVGKSWTLPAQKLLFKRVQLCSQAAYNSFACAVSSSTQRGRVLANSVLQMRVVLDNNQPGPLKQACFARAVTLCPNLRELNLALYGCGEPGKDVVGSPALERMRRPAPSFERSTLDLLRTGPSITSLRFSNWSDNGQSIVQLLDIWPSLTSLSITGKTPHFSPGLTHPPYACPLTRLTMDCQLEPSLDFLQWLLHGSSQAKSLRAIDLDRQPSLDLLDYLTRTHGESLRELALPSCRTLEHANAVIRCHSLRDLRTERASTSPVVFRKLPAGIRRIAFGMDEDTPLQHVIEAVNTRDELDTVTVNLWGRGGSHRELSRLKMACAFRGVDLRITSDVRVHRAMVVSR
ncbi:hypothetical protein PAXRUDRAFT_128969 [Paxillus rubicundulus Ve08.2h10]|uniref:F-box domain-containing protein n=1 Tax=Paxillus rubicundulus Ve08.2h10 TaxID=930991 RepID=A0A0D0DYG5_9AGAM|nr:hypothetical protein PAXRUDRAFT_128969 [Paxillus rubicundulus Ve08.2h10]